MKNSVVWLFAWLTILVWSTPAQAQTTRKLFSLIRSGQQSLAEGKLEETEKATKQAEAVLKKVGKRLRPYQRTYFQLTILRLWFEFYKLRGKEPRIVNLDRVDNMKEFVEQRMAQIKDSVGDLEQARDKISDYNKLLLGIVQRYQRTGDKIRLVNSQSIQRDLEGDIKRLRLRVQVLMNRRDQLQKKNKPAPKKNSRKVIEAQLKAEAERKKLKKQQVRIAKAINQLQNNYIADQKRLDKRGVLAKNLKWSGVGVGVAGAVAVGVGAAFLVLQDDKSLDGGLAQVYLNSSIPLLVGGGVAVAAGLTLIVVGVVADPGERTRAGAVLRVHTDSFEKKDDKSSSLRTIRRIQPTHQPPPPANATVLGRW